MTSTTNVVKKPHSLSLSKMIMIALIVAMLYWGGALLIRDSRVLNVWTDQSDKFTRTAQHFFDPYDGLSGFFSPPWATIPLIPFSFMPLSLSTLIQALIYFSLLTTIAKRYGMTTIGWVAVLSSPLAFDAIIELNIDWIAAIGLLVPAQFSPIFLAVKPQAFPGYIFTLNRKQLVRAILIFLCFLLVSFMVWGVDWILKLYEELGTRTLALSTSLSPWAFMPPLLSIVLGCILLAYAFYKNDDVIKILSGVFFTPYLPTYTAIIPFLFICIRFPRVGVYISIALWMITLFIMWQLNLF